MSSGDGLAVCRLVSESRGGDIRVAAILGTTADVSVHAGHTISAFMISAYRQSSLARGRVEARRQLARLAFALAAFHAERGAYPPLLDELAPVYLDEVPFDPFTAAPLRYELGAPDGYRLYSVGENLTDDGGRGHESDKPGDDISIGVPFADRPGEPEPRPE